MSATAAVLLNRLLARTRLRHLQVLVATAELGSFRKAGQATGLTQPAITHVVAELEELLGLPLFQRHARGVRPTPECLELLPQARRAVQALGLGMEALVARQDGSAGLVKLGTTAAAAAGLLAEALPPLMGDTPPAAVHVVEAEPAALMDMVQRAELDLVACRQPGITPQGWQFRALRPDRLVVACGRAHPLRGRRRWALPDLAAEAWLAAPVSTLGRRVLDSLFAQHGLAPRYVHLSTVAVALTTAMLARHRLLTLIPESVVLPGVQAGLLRVLPVAGLPELGPLGLLAPAQPPQGATRALLEGLCDWAAARQG